MTNPLEPKGPDEPGTERSPQLQAFEAQLAGLVPRDDRLDRDRLMYLAGQASVQAEGGVAAAPRPRWAVPASLGAAAGALAASLLMTMFTPRVDLPAPGGNAAPQVALAETANGGAASVADATIGDLVRLIDSLRADVPLTAASVVRGAPIRRGAPEQEAEAVANAAPPATSAPLTSRSIDEVLEISSGANRSS